MTVINSRKSCEDQYKFYSKAIAKLKDAKSNTCIANGGNSQQVSKDISEGIEILSKRQKLIKMTDSSEYGRLLVEQYQTNPLADDSDDEKII